MSETQRMNNIEAAAYIGVTPGTLETWRCTKRYSIPYAKIGRKVVYYRHDLDAWLESRKVAVAGSLD